MTLILDSKREQLDQGEPDFSQLAMEHRSAAFFGGVNLNTIRFEEEEEEYEYEDEDEYEDEEEGDEESEEEEDGEGTEGSDDSQRTEKAQRRG